MTTTPPPTDSSPGSASPSPFLLGAKVSLAMLAGPVVLLVGRYVVFGLGDDPVADALSHLPALLLMWCGVGAVTGTALAYLTGNRTSFLVKLLLGTTVGALTVAAGMALASPVWPFDPDERARQSPLAIAVLLATMGLVGGGIVGAVAAVVFDAVPGSFLRAVWRALFCAVAYALWMLGTAR